MPRQYAGPEEKMPILRQGDCAFPAMDPLKRLTPELLDLLQNVDTCRVSNAIERLELRMRDEGYIQKALHCTSPELPPTVGYAVTGRIRTSVPPIARRCYYQRPDWWEYVASVPGPKIVVIADVDRAPATAAFFGEIHAEIARALGCRAYVSNGAVRDVPALNRLRFPCLTGGVVVSHAYAHLIDFGEPVEIGSLKIASGDILHVDCHGALSIPPEALTLLPAALKTIEEREARLIDLCRSPGFSVAKRAAALERTEEGGALDAVGKRP